MNNLNLLEALLTFAISFVTCFYYKKKWKSYFGLKKIPKGVGVFLSPLLLLMSIFGIIDIRFLPAFLIICFGTFFYWFDDLIEISALSRVIICLVTGMLLAYLTLEKVDTYKNFDLIVIILIFGVLNLILTNIVNFYDGADLNLATLIFLFVINAIYFTSLNENLSIFSLYPVGFFVLAFSIFNAKIKSLYFGDSGSFAFASLVLLILILNLKNIHSDTLVFLIPFWLPFIDVLFVIIYRILKNENLLTRNYLHIYQKIQIKYKGKFYILPQITSYFLIFFSVNFSQKINDDKYIFISLFIILILYLITQLLIEDKKNNI